MKAGVLQPTLYSQHYTQTIYINSTLTVTQSRNTSPCRDNVKETVTTGENFPIWDLRWKPFLSLTDAWQQRKKHFLRKGKLFGSVSVLAILASLLPLHINTDTHIRANTHQWEWTPDIIPSLLSDGADSAHFWSSALLTVLLWKWRRARKVNLHRKLPSL